MVGVFVLTIGITTALGLAISIFNASTSAVKQVVGAGLAREGVEAVFNMRATNWLKGSLDPAGCYNFVTDTNNAAPCHTDWQYVSGWYDLRTNPSASPNTKTFTLDFNPNQDATGPFWSLIQETQSKYALNYDATAAAGRFYYPSGAATGTSGYYRKITLKEEQPAYTNDPDLRRLRVISQVWWTDRGCPVASDWSATVPKCRIELVSYMTNWKNY